MKSTEHILNDLENHIVLFNKLNTGVSDSSIGWHIEHSLKVINQIAIVLEKSNPKEYNWKFNFWRIVIMTSKKIPRGRAKAPKTVVPEGIITIETLQQSLEKARVNLKKTETFDSNTHFLHPYFGVLNLRPTQAFLAIHTNHHLKIIKDIAKN